MRASAAPRTDAVDHDRGAIDLYPRVGDDRWSDPTMARAAWGFVGLGLTIRVVRLLLNHPLWGDECFVAANLIDRSYLGLLRPLDYQQVAPAFFLWAELAATRIFGFSEWSLRIFPTSCAIVSLFVFRHLASRLLKGLPMLMSVAIVAVSLNPIRHGGEAKPYAVDFLVSTTILAILVEWWRQPDRSRWLWVLALASPIAMGLSLPSVFVLGGIVLAIPGRFRVVREPRVVAAYLALVAAIAAGFAATLIWNGAARSTKLLMSMDYYWSGQFPMLDDPARLVGWLIRAHTGHLFAYPVGGGNGASVLTAILAVVGLVDLARRGRGTIALACVAPLGLALIASTLRAYPYGETERLMQFEGPMICLLAGHGLARTIGRARRPGSYRRLAMASLIGFGGIGMGALVFDIAHPYRTLADLQAREFARWFWAEMGTDAELACVRVDLGLDFEGGATHDGRSADYLTYQKINFVRRRERKPLEWARVSPGHPLRCVIYDGVPFDSTLFEAWMGRMARHYRLSRVETYRVNSGVAPKGLSAEDHLAVLEFVPIGPPVDPSKLAREAIAAESRANRGSLSLPGS